MDLKAQHGIIGIPEHLCSSLACVETYRLEGLAGVQRLHQRFRLYSFSSLPILDDIGDSHMELEDLLVSSASTVACSPKSVSLASHRLASPALLGEDCREVDGLDPVRIQSQGQAVCVCIVRARPLAADGRDQIPVRRRRDKAHNSPEALRSAFPQHACPRACAAHP